MLNSRGTDVLLIRLLFNMIDTVTRDYMARGGAFGFCDTHRAGRLVTYIVTCVGQERKNTCAAPIAGRYVHW